MNAQRNSKGWQAGALSIVLAAGSLAQSAEPGAVAPKSVKQAAPPSALFLPSPSSPLVAVRFLFRVGSQDDPKGKEGLAALTASMISEGGTKTLTYDQILGKFYPIASSLSGSCHKEVTVFSGEVHRDNLKAYEELATSMLAAPRFAEDDFDRLKNEAIDYLSKSLRGNNDEELGKWALQLELYKNHPYGHVDQGTVEGLKAISLDDVKAFYRAHYTRGTLQLGVAGGVQPEFVAKIENDLNLPNGTYTAPALPKPASVKGIEVTIVEKPADATAISLGFPIDVTRKDDDFYALAVANSYLGEHRTFNGKLMQDLRGKRGLNYGDYSYVEDFIQEGMSTFPIPNNPRRQQAFTIWLRPVPRDKAVFALRGALWELDRLVEKGMSPEDFEATRSFLLNYSKLWVQTLSRRLGYAMDGSFYDREDLVTELARRLPTLTVEQVNAAVRRHLNKPGIKVAIVAQEAAALKEALLSGKPSPIVYDTEGTPETILAEDKVIETFPLDNLNVKVVPVGELFEK
ncbi:M16 family metallopeptidase [Singulisphaera sp. PoT]|uniref:M16 family metallopeptidase n=1 Tax=Singulisphaera sp. PoT TaxID=3411797 RepID=UPI003BF515C3